MVAWHQMYQAAHGTDERRPFSRATLARIGRFARPHRRRIVAFLALSVRRRRAGGGDAGAGGPRRRRDRRRRARVGGRRHRARHRGHRDRGGGASGSSQRWLSSTLGEGLILDLRAAVFDHVQRQPVAFFTRTRTGALVSRLNNDVIGAQRAFTDTLSGVVGNVVTLALTLVVMLGLSWQVTRAGAGAAADLRAARQADGPPPRRSSTGRRPTTTRPWAPR